MSAEVYDEEGKRWTPGEMTKPPCSHIAVPLTDGRVFLTGGGSGRLADLGSAEFSDPAPLTFSSLGGMRDNHYLATRRPDGRVLLTGGQSERGEIVASAELFDPAADTFEATGDMRTARVKHAATVLSDGRVLTARGELGGPQMFATASVLESGDAATFVK